MTKPTVLVIAPTPYFSDRGCHIRIYEELKLIEQFGYQAQLVTYPLGRDLGAVTIHRTKSLPWYHKTTAGPALSKLLLDVFLLVLARRITKQLRPQIIHAHLAESMLIACWLKLQWRIPIVLDLQSVFDIELKSYGGMWKICAPIAKLYERWAIAQADHVIVSNEAAAKILKERYPDRPVVVLADGIGQVQTTPIEKTYDIVYSGGLGKQKGTDQLIDILKKVSTKNILIIASDPGDVWKKKLRYRTWINRIPYEELLPTLAQAKIGIEPKPIESTEGSAKELNYMAAGVVPAHTSDDVQKLLNDETWYEKRHFEISQNISDHLWSRQQLTLKKVYESCTT